MPGVSGNDQTMPGAGAPVDGFTDDGLITFIFAGMVFRRYAVRRGFHLLIWGIGRTITFINPSSSSMVMKTNPLAAGGRCLTLVLPGTCANVPLVPLIGTPHFSWSLAAAAPPADLAPINVTPTLREAVHEQWRCQGD